MDDETGKLCKELNHNSPDSNVELKNKPSIDLSKVGIQPRTLDLKRQFDNATMVSYQRMHVT